MENNMENNMEDNSNDTQTPITQDNKNLSMLMWIGTFFFGFIPGLIIYLLKTDDPYLQDQSKEALNWAITAIIGYAISFILMFVLIGILLMFILVIVHLVFCIMGAIAASSGKPFRVPYAIRFIK
ncbi:MAG: DUF4870 domain-containing protein [Xanthomonadales bacterium]|nr:DUF4870 domain-containing protein [Xanthomonadales bacterium]